MALKSTSISILFLLNILFAMAGHALAGRIGPSKPKEDDKIQPDCFLDPDGSVLIPGVGRIFPGGSHSSVRTYSNNGGGSVPSYTNSGGGSGPRYIPGGDDTFVPNPGYEVPIPFWTWSIAILESSQLGHRFWPLLDKAKSIWH